MSEQVKPAPKAYQANVFWDRQDCATLSAQVYLASDADSCIDALHAEAEALRAENGRLSEYSRQWEELQAQTAARLNSITGERNRLNNRCVELRTELEAARGLIGQLHAGLRSLKESVFPDDPHGTASMHEFIDALLSLTATPAPEVPDHLRDSAKMAEQGERQEAQVMGRVHHNPDHPEPVRAVLNSIGRQLPDNAPLYTTPQPGPDVRALVEALEQIARWDGFPPTGKFWECSGAPMSYRACYGSNGERDYMRNAAAIALNAYRQAQQGGSHEVS